MTDIQMLWAALGLTIVFFAAVVLYLHIAIKKHFQMMVINNNANRHRDTKIEALENRLNDITIEFNNQLNK